MSPGAFGKIKEVRMTSDTVALFAIVIFDASDGLFLAGGISAGEAEYSGGCPVAARNVQLPIS
jgi:hypothetical protein